MSLVFYHGTTRDFEKPKLQNGILWLAPNPLVAKEYANPHYSKRDGYVWEITLKPNARIVNLRDLDHPVIREAFEMMNEQARSGLGAWSEEYWRDNVDFGVLEYRRWMPGFFKKRIDGLVIQDRLGTTPIKHESVALLRLAAIQGMARKVVEGGRAERTIGEIEEELRSWGRMAHRVVRRYKESSPSRRFNLSP